MTNQQNESLNFDCAQESPDARVDDVELACFLRNLATLYKSPLTGNPALSNALGELASWVAKRSSVTKKPSKSVGNKSKLIPSLDLSQLKNLDAKSIEDFLLDETRTKLELIELAFVRFSIPRSRLNRTKTSAVRETIKAALLHEGSIKIISQEAAKDGGNRNS
ncbi:MAG: hypothetical protein Q8L80_06670 [Gallionella sp.]|nr:hypothetical protein [Gallionella sp.]MDP1939879.1 hypothetical protein [Gallionella sp.]